MAEDSGVTRRGALAAAGGAAALAGLAPAAAQAAAKSHLGEPKDGTAAAEVIGRLDQNADTITGYGYLTRVHGLAQASLFRTAQHDESSARLTFAAQVHVNARFFRGNLISVDGVGSVTFFADGDGASFDNPATFSNGKQIATFDARFQNLLSVIAPHQGISTINGELTQKQAHSFAIGGHTTRFGRKGLVLLLTVSGPSTRTADNPPIAFFDVAGQLTVGP
jgi:hypothetical protein